MMKFMTINDSLQKLHNGFQAVQFLNPKSKYLKESKEKYSFINFLKWK